jgi:hypothetical protein
MSSLLWLIGSFPLDKTQFVKVNKSKKEQAKPLKSNAAECAYKRQPKVLLLFEMECGLAGF